MLTIPAIILEAPDPDRARAFYDKAFGLGALIDVRAADAPSEGFRGYTLSLVVAQPGTVDALTGTALDAGATPIKAVTKTFWGYGGTLRAPDGAIWKVASSKKKDSGPATREVDDVVLLLGVADVKASKRFYVDRGLEVKRSFGSKYVEFEAPSARVKLALYGRDALAQDAGVRADGTGSHRISIAADGPAFTDPDGFAWEPVSA